MNTEAAAILFARETGPRGRIRRRGMRSPFITMPSLVQPGGSVQVQCHPVRARVLDEMVFQIAHGLRWGDTNLYARPAWHIWWYIFRHAAVPAA